MGKASQRKGARGEEELAAAGYPVERGGSCFGEKPDLYGLPDVHVEVKRREALNITEAMAQARRDADKFHDGHPAVFHRRNRQPWLVTMPLESWIEIYSAFQREKSGKKRNIEEAVTDVDRQKT